MSLNEEFSSRWGLIATSLGMAIGAGNLWRFPRFAGQYGGTFILLWMFFLLIWSIPILLSEFAIGKTYKQGVVACYANVVGKKFTWMGIFIALCTLGITFYYSVVTAWGLSYLGFSLSFLFKKENLFNMLKQQPDLITNYWNDISYGSLGTVFLHIFIVLLVGFVLLRGVRAGFEKANKIFIPVLFILLMIIALIAINMGNGIKGIEYMFNINFNYFKEPDVWLEALSQSAWSTGAGWGLIMTIGSYTRKKEDVTLNIFISGFGNNTASLLASMAILPSVFALSVSDWDAIKNLSSGNQALTFNIIPALFAKIPGGIYMSILFFTAFFLAAFSSLLSLSEMFIKIIGDFGFSRKKSVLIATSCCVIFGFPSAYSLDFFNNQDWVWGIGLIVSGSFIVFATFRYGAIKLKKNLIDKDSNFKLSSLYFFICMSLNIILAPVLIWWWMSRGESEYPWFDMNGNWNIIDIYSNATIISQWFLAILIGLILNGFLYKKFVKK